MVEKTEIPADIWEDFKDAPLVKDTLAETEKEPLDWFDPDGAVQDAIDFFGEAAAPIEDWRRLPRGQESAYWAIQCLGWKLQWLALDMFRPLLRAMTRAAYATGDFLEAINGISGGHLSLKPRDKPLYRDDRRRK
jgi:hypothetical protein